ncbi:hypothetical protein BTO20_29845 [Mycobacterium dioxanotrophicus]|uniref:DUF2771 domain-containing protein n=1 Tax=Mycobacterium dioxanotrophicus TaxID=482462 RepID=A0A1Y0CAB9_9MYCO|nr:DUF2771 domain-containing protein [Mycobacterium dioxanotrophicus]ART72198.1 hypothetical protein BTO20_29845 [Mycobacterium dioxanotrophicus]
MRRFLAILAVIVVVAAAGTAVAVTQLSHGHDKLPKISAYSNGHLTRVGPFRYCPVLNLNDCTQSGSQGELRVNKEHPVQLSVPAEIARAPWRLLRVYENPIDTTLSLYRPNTTLAVTIPTVDPQRGRLTGIAVQLLTLVQDQNGDVFDLPHAEWSVRTVWPDKAQPAP